MPASARNGMSEIGQLHALRDRPAEQAALAVRLLRPQQKRDVLLAALKALVAHPLPEARDALLAVYEWFAANGPKRDPGAYTRQAILNALRPVALAEDIDLLARAASTYERLPPKFLEEAGLLRAGALVALSDLDAELARFHAARLMVDGHSDPMSAEPALTAARVLAGLGETLCLYQYAMRADDQTLAEVVSECLRVLTDAPGSVVDGIVDRYRDTTAAVVLVGLFDLLLQHRQGPLRIDFLTESLTSVSDTDALHYLAIGLVGSRRPELVAAVQTEARLARDASRRAALEQALALFGRHSDA